MTGTTQPVPRGPHIRRAVVTGSAGFIGSHLAHALLREGTTVIGVDRRHETSDQSAAANLAPLIGQPGFIAVTADLLNCALEPVLLDADVVFHLAGMPGVRPSWGTQFGAYVQCNILAAQRVMDAATRLGVPRVVVASSSSVYGPTTSQASLETDHPHPASPYAVTKLAEEQLCLAHAGRPDCRTGVAALRYFTVYGPRQRADMFIQRALSAALTGATLRVYGDGRQRRDFTYIDDTVAATLAAATASNDTGVVNVGGGTNASLTEVIQLAEQLTGRTVPVEYFTTRNGDVPLTRADGSRALTHLGWKPKVDLTSGMAAQLQHLIRSTARQAA
ncbi:NAD-dependent epimerase/dehydratase family protein [Streptomyces sp. SL13]|uniref:NAD-dependent epimerase/dehydratase family protein n=1 Tax=Streptantibioticus silvisoli TaxID=2705255 RepID=A0AA90KGW5_9ACTN|nr:NAD-dependent epimerase/dehydratase family protein [Streptantibioticus silvisoli]MDI5971085.1 NAD-dependent epimerase/dehydratase family protein [Streptantibioticus silvisoli]